MVDRTTVSGSSAPPLNGATFLNEYAQRVKTLFDASALPLTAVGGTGNAVTATLDPALDTGGLVEGMKFTITWAAANTGAVTLAINGATAVAVVDADGVALGASALVAGRRSLIERVGSAFRILSSAGGAGAGAGPTYQAFTTSGTWTKPTGYDDDTVVMVEVWGAGGGGGRGTASSGGAGGGAYARRMFRIVDLPSSVTVTIGAAGTGSVANPGNGTAGGNTTFGSLVTGFGGGGGGGAGAAGAGGGGGGGTSTAGANGTNALPGLGGRAGGGPGGTGAVAETIVDGVTDFGGGGGGAGNSGIGFRGGYATFGGAGGGGTSGAGSGAAGVSTFGGNGGAAPGGTGVAPGGGGAGGTTGVAGGNGARGECRVWIFG